MISAKKKNSAHIYIVCIFYSDLQKFFFTILSIICAPHSIFPSNIIIILISMRKSFTLTLEPTFSFRHQDWNIKSISDTFLINLPFRKHLINSQATGQHERAKESNHIFLHLGWMPFLFPQKTSFTFSYGKKNKK